MSPHVSGNGRALRKLASTYFARERLLARMRPQVSGQIGRLSECLITLVTLVRFLTRMGSHVSFKSARSRVSFVAHSASIDSIDV